MNKRYINQFITKDATDVAVGDSREFNYEFTALSKKELVKQLGEDVPKGYIAGFASTPDMDQGRDVVVSGAFDESIKERGLMGPRGIKLLLGHKWDKVAGVIKVLETRNGNLWIEAQLNLDISYVKDAYLAAKDLGGLSFSVGFKLQDYEFKEDEDGNIQFLQINKGDLFEVSVTPFPMNEAAEMSFIKEKEENFESVQKFEKQLVASGLAGSRNKAREITNLVKSNISLFQKTDVTPAVKSTTSPITVESLAKFREGLDELKQTLDSVKINDKDDNDDS